MGGESGKLTSLPYHRCAARDIELSPDAFAALGGGKGLQSIEVRWGLIFAGAGRV